MKRSNKLIYGVFSLLLGVGLFGYFVLTSGLLPSSASDSFQNQFENVILVGEFDNGEVVSGEIVLYEDAEGEKLALSNSFSCGLTSGQTVLSLTTEKRVTQNRLDITGNVPQKGPATFPVPKTERESTEFEYAILWIDENGSDKVVALTRLTA